MNHTPVISVIVPVYKVEQYLARCVDSILSQTFKDFEVLLIDDGSPDKSGEICDQYAAKDSRVKVYHKENEGVSSARNYGINKAEGVWLFFSDADDYLPNNSFDVLINFAYDNVDCVMAGYSVFTEKGEVVVSKPKDRHNLLSVADALNEMFHPTDFPYQGYLWCKLFKHEIVSKNELKFNESIYYNEDRLFIVQFLCKSNNIISYTTKPVYYYIERGTGAMGSLKKCYSDKFITDFEAFILMKKSIRLNKFNKKIIKYVNYGIAQSYIINHNMMIQHKAYDERNHMYMLKELAYSGAMIAYFKICIKQFLKPILLLIRPSLLLR